MANQINAIGLSSYNLGLHCDFHYTAYGKMVTAGAEALHIENLLPAYGELVETESGIVRRQTAYVSTKQLKEMDNVRDNAMGIILNVITAHLTASLSCSCPRTDSELNSG